MATYRLPELGRFAPCGNQGPVLVGLRHVHLDLEQEERRVLSPPGLAHVEKHVQVQQVPECLNVRARVLVHKGLVQHAARLHVRAHEQLRFALPEQPQRVRVPTAAAFGAKGAAQLLAEDVQRLAEAPHPQVQLQGLRVLPATTRAMRRLPHNARRLVLALALALALAGTAAAAVTAAAQQLPQATLVRNPAPLGV